MDNSKPPQETFASSVTLAHTNSIRPETTGDHVSLSMCEQFAPTLEKVARVFEEPRWDVIIAKPDRSSNVAQSVHNNISILCEMGMLQSIGNFRRLAYERLQRTAQGLSRSSPIFGSPSQNKIAKVDTTTVETDPDDRAARLYMPIARMASRFRPIDPVVTSSLYTQPAELPKHKKIRKACICDRRRNTESRAMNSSAFGQIRARVRTFWGNHNTMYPYTFKKKVQITYMDTGEEGMIEIIDYTNKVMDLNRLAAASLAEPAL